MTDGPTKKAWTTPSVQRHRLSLSAQVGSDNNTPPAYTPPGYTPPGYTPSYTPSGYYTPAGYYTPGYY